nr:SIR2 family protein [Rhizobium leguminosarum]
MVAGNAAVFAGAGLSVPAGFVDWRNLLRPLADDLDLDIDRETDLVAVAQFHVNAHGANRHKLHQAVIDALSADNPPTKNHELLARLPISTWWTTNYDKLIETSLKQAGKIVDVKTSVPQLANTRPRRDAIVYKMHGDVDHPSEAVVTRDDYERYELDRGTFLNALGGDLVSKTFLFLGFSFTDPNLDYVLSRLRLKFKADQRGHYAIFKKRSRLKGEDDDGFEYARIRQALVIEDLKRFNVKAVMIDDYAEITEILEELSRRYRRQSVFISASAASFEPWGEAAVFDFMRQLGKALIANSAKVATGLGAGVGNAIFTGALEQIMEAKAGHIEDFLAIRPFPNVIPDNAQRRAIWDRYRREIIHNTGIALFLFGNRDVQGTIKSASGMEKEFEIAKEEGLFLLPVGATGSTAKSLATKIANSDIDSKYLNQFLDLQKPTDDLLTLIGPIVELVTTIREGK